MKRIRKSAKRKMAVRWNGLVIRVCSRWRERERGRGKRGEGEERDGMEAGMEGEASKRDDGEDTFSLATDSSP